MFPRTLHIRDINGCDVVDGVYRPQQTLSAYYMPIIFSAMGVSDLILDPDAVIDGFLAADLMEAIGDVMRARTIDYLGHQIPITPEMFDGHGHLPAELQNAIIGATGMGPLLMAYVRRVVSDVMGFAFSVTATCLLQRH
jgi:hypothetical protein